MVHEGLVQVSENRGSSKPGGGVEASAPTPDWGPAGASLPYFLATSFTLFQIPPHQPVFQTLTAIEFPGPGFK